MWYRYYILNVFSEKGVEGGNQLAVLPNTDNLDTNSMQQIAKEFNFSESTFVNDIQEREAAVRIFTPGKEIEYAGHPSIGTLYVLEMLYRQDTGKKRSEYNLILKGGEVEGIFDTTSEDLGIVKFIQAPATIMGKFEDRVRLLRILGLNENDLANDLPFYLASVTSMKFLFVHVKDQETLESINPDMSALSSGIFKEDDINVYVFTKGCQDGGTVKTRFFVPLYGIPEDPATGGVQSSFGLALLKHGLLNEGKNEVIVEQGYEIGRPSKIYDEFYVENNELVKTVTGGKCFLFSKGKLTI